MAASEAHPTQPFREELFRVLASPLFQFLAATAVAFVVFFARAPAAYLSPLLFAELLGILAQFALLTASPLLCLPQESLFRKDALSELRKA